MIHAALIGISGFGHVHYQDLLRQIHKGTTRLLAATVINQDEEEKKCALLRSLGCQLFTDYQAMIQQFQGQLDLCYIPTGIPLHRPMTIAALQAGANVYVEKPAAATIQDVRAMQAAEREAGKFVAVGFQTMYAREMVTMKQIITSGRLGKILAIKSRGLWTRSDGYYARNNWAGKLQIKGTWTLDSPFNNAIAHQLNAICFLAGPDLTHAADLHSIQAELFCGHDIESADTAALRIHARRPDGSTFPLYFYVTHCPENNLNPEIIVRGELGQLHWTLDKTLHFQLNDGTVEEWPVESGEALRDSVQTHLHRRLTDPNAFVCTLDIASRHTLCVNGAHDSSPVIPIPPQYLRRVPIEDSVKTIITGLDDLIAQAFTQEKLFSDLHAPWAKPGALISLENYTQFPSRKHT